MERHPRKTVYICQRDLDTITPPSLAYTSSTNETTGRTTASMSFRGAVWGSPRKEQLHGTHHYAYQQLKVTKESGWRSAMTTKPTPRHSRQSRCTIQLRPEESRLKCSHPKNTLIADTTGQRRWWYLGQICTAFAVYLGRSTLMELWNGSREQLYMSLGLWSSLFNAISPLWIVLQSQRAK